MNSSQERQLLDEEISWTELLNLLWEKNLAILSITALCACLGAAYIFLAPGKYIGEFTVRGPIGAQLVSYVPLNEDIQKYYGEYLEHSLKMRDGTAADGTDATVNQFGISSDSLVQDMVRELQSYTPFMNAIKEHSPSIRDMSAEDFEDVRRELFSTFTVRNITSDNPEVSVTLKWPDSEQLLHILESTLLNADIARKENKISFLNGLADNIDRRNANEGADVARGLAILKEIIDLETQSKLLFLQEQGEIARALNLSENSLSEGGEQQSNLSVSVVMADEKLRDDQPKKLQNMTSSTAYLRGHTSLDTEAALIKSRTGDATYLLDVDFLALRNRQLELKNDESAAQFRETIAVSPFLSDNNIFAIDRSSILIEDQRNVPLILTLSIILGLLVGCATVLVQRSSMLK